MHSSDSIVCFSCNNSLVFEDSVFIFCETCKSWFHNICVGLSTEEVKIYSESDSLFLCHSCSSKHGLNNSTLNDPSTDLVTCPLCPHNDVKYFKGSRGLRIHWTRVHSTEPFCSPSLSVRTDNNSFNLKLARCKLNIKVLRWIPKGARSSAANKLFHLIENCLSENTVQCWQELLLFSYIALRISDQTNRKLDRSLVSQIKDNINNFKLGVSLRKNKIKITKSRLVEAKVVGGDIWELFEFYLQIQV